MNCRDCFSKKFTARILFAVVALVLFFQAAGNVWAQERWLLIFENSAAMKKRMPAVAVEVQKLFFTSMAGQMHAGDSLGVWTFDQTLHVGEFPLSIWQPDLAANTASNLVVFLNKRSFKGEVNFNALQPVLSEVVAGSQRLTVLVFCEGQGDFIWTPYNDAINQSLREHYAERKKDGQPFVILLRVQDGKYFGCSINFPPGGLNLPIFPTVPEVAKPVAAATNLADAELVREKKHVPLDTSPLIMVGKNVVTNRADLPALLEKMRTNPPAIAPALVSTNQLPTTNLPVAETNRLAQSLAQTNLPVAAVALPLVGNASARPAADIGYQLLLGIGVLALILAVILLFVLIARSRQPRGSLITDSLNAPRSPPRKP